MSVLLSAVLFITFTDRIFLDAARGWRKSGLGGTGFYLCNFADDVTLLAPLNWDLHHALGRFTDKCYAAGIMDAIAYISAALSINQTTVASWFDIFNLYHAQTTA